MASTPSWDNKGLPKNLAILIRSKESHERFRLHDVYALELQHRGANCIAACLKGNNLPIITTNPGALCTVAKALPPRKFKMTKGVAYINFQLAAAYIIYGATSKDLEKSEPRKLFIPESIKVLLEAKKSFGWNSESDGEEIPQEVFLKEVEFAARLHTAA